MHIEENFLVFLEALEFAALKHRNQRRKGSEKVPYINHPVQVAKVLYECGCRNANLLVAALLHDTVEDTETQPEEIEQKFGSQVANLVMHVTDDKKLPYQERKRLQVVTAPKKPPLAKCLKIADKICNLRDLAADPPPDWSSERRQKYLYWAKDVVKGLRGENAELDHLFDQTFDKARKVFEKDH